jgi:hypothetical protein
MRSNNRQLGNSAVTISSTFGHRSIQRLGEPTGHIPGQSSGFLGEPLDFLGKILTFWARRPFWRLFVQSPRRG